MNNNMMNQNMQNSFRQQNSLRNSGIQNSFNQDYNYDISQEKPIPSSSPENQKMNFIESRLDQLLRMQNYNGYWEPSPFTSEIIRYCCSIQLQQKAKTYLFTKSNLRTNANLYSVILNTFLVMNSLYKVSKPKQVEKNLLIYFNKADRFLNMHGVKYEIIWHYSI